MKGYAKKHGIDDDEVFSPVAKLESIIILIAIAAQENWELHHLDVKTAFLNGEIKEDVYITQPNRFFNQRKRGLYIKIAKGLISFSEIMTFRSFFNFLLYQ